MKKTLIFAYGIKSSVVNNDIAAVNDFSLIIRNANDPQYPAALKIEAFTPNLYLKGIDYVNKSAAIDADVKNLLSLYSNAKVMRHYAAGTTKTLEQTIARIELLRSRMQNGDPYSGYMVYDRKTNNFLGIATIGHCDKPGEAELALILAPEYWQQYKATEIALLLLLVVDKLAQDYPITNQIKRFDAQTNKNYYNPHTDQLTKLTATGKRGRATVHLLQQMGFEQVGTSELYGDGDNIREIWSINVSAIKPMLEQTNNLNVVRQKIRARL